MEKAAKDILTTAETARLLGVSIRTAQLLIEGGSVPSWKTPGGHRRVYRADIEALIEGRSNEPPRFSATVVIVAPARRHALYQSLFATVAEFAAEIYEDAHAALFAIGSVRPHAIVVDLEDAAAERLSLLPGLLRNPSLGHSLIFTVAASEAIPHYEGRERVARVDGPEQAVAAIRRSMADDVSKVAIPTTGMPFPIALNEAQRLVAMERTGLLDTVPEEPFDRLTWLAAQSLGAPIALITLLTPTRQWFKSRVGLDLPETPRSWAFCNHTITQKGVFSVEDLSRDARFADNPAVVGDPGFRFYAGVPVLDGDGFAVGSLCAIDYQPRKLDERGAQTLVAFAALASDEVRLRATDRRLREMLRRSERNASNRREPADNG